MAYQLGGRNYTSKASILARARQIKDSHKPGDQLEGEELAFMLSLLCWHPSAVDKIGVGIRAIWIRANPMLGHNEFYLWRVDQTGTEFSYKKCVYPATPEAYFKQACRVAVASDLIRYRDYKLSEKAVVRCEFTGEILKIHNSHVDHVPPKTFARLIEVFVRIEKLDMRKVEVAGKHKDNCFRITIANDILRERWITFHSDHATVRLISKTANEQLVSNEWNTIFNWLRKKQHKPVLVEWKERRWYYYTPEWATRGVFVEPHNAPKNVLKLDGAIPLIEMSLEETEEVWDIAS